MDVSLWMEQVPSYEHDSTSSGVRQPAVPLPIERVLFMNFNSHLADLLDRLTSWLLFS